MDQLNSAFSAPHSTVYRVTYAVTYISSFLQIVASVLMPIKIWRNRKSSGFSITFQCFCIIAFGYRYVFNEVMDQQEILGIMDIAYSMQHLTRILVLISTVVTLCLSICFPDDKEFEDEFDKWCIPGGLIVSCVLGVDGRNITAIDLWTVGSFLEVIAWIPQLKLSLIRRPVDWHVMYYIVSMFIYDIYSLIGLSYDFYRNNLYKNVGYNLSLLKFLLFCGFFIRYSRCMSLIKNKVIAITVQPAPSAPPPSAQEFRANNDYDKSAYCIRVDENASMNQQGLTARF